jgi:hypothetical protein
MEYLEGKTLRQSIGGKQTSTDLFEKDLFPEFYSKKSNYLLIEDTFLFIIIL